MLSEINTKLDNQGSRVTELNNLLQEEIALRKQDQVKLVQLENTVTEMNTRLEGKLNTAVAGLQETLVQLHHSLISHEKTVLVDMYQRLTQQQNEACAAILNTIKQNFKAHTDVLKRPTASDEDVVQTKLSKQDIDLRMPDPASSSSSSSIPFSRPNPSISINFKKRNADTLVNIVPGKTAGSAQATCDTVSTTTIRSNLTTNLAALLSIHCYENWDPNKHEQLTELTLVEFQKLYKILVAISNKGSTTFDYLSNSIETEQSLTPDDIASARRGITTLSVSKVSKYKRFPSTGKFVDINLNSKKNLELKKMFRTTDGSTFFDAARSYMFFTRDNALGQLEFECMQGLQWTETVIID